MSKEAFAVRELNHVALHVRDLAVSEHFYGEILGLPPIPRPNFPFRVSWFALGSQELHLIQVDEVRIPAPERPATHFAMKVDDAYAAYDALVAAGVPNPSRPAPRPDGPIQVFFRDPDGHLLEITSFPAK